MRNRSSNDVLAEGNAGQEARQQGGSQTLLRGLDIVEAVAERTVPLADLARMIGLTRSTTHRLATALVDRGYLNLLPRTGYQLGPKLLQLGFLAQQQMDLVQVARPHLEILAAATGDTVHLGVLEGDSALYLVKIPGRRRVEIRSRVGDRHPLTSTGLGKALLLDDDPGRWETLFHHDQARGSAKTDYLGWIRRMHGYAEHGHAFDLEENEDLIRCVAAPVRDASGKIVAAISVSSAAQYMADDRMEALTRDIRETADAIGQDLGWSAAGGTRGEGPGRDKA